MSVFTKEQQAQLDGLTSDKTTAAAGSTGASGKGGSIFDRLLNQESGGSQFNDDGSVKTSKKGAIGIAQVMPATGPEAAKLAGLPWDENRYRKDPEYNKALGRAYFEEQLRTFGDERTALAAYNAGPGATARAVARAKREGGDFLAYLPEETRKYVPAIMGGKFSAKPLPNTPEGRAIGGSTAWDQQPRYQDPGFNAAFEREALLDAADESPVSTSLGRGWEGLKHNAGLFLDNVTDDSQGAAERIKAKRQWDEQNPAPRSSQGFVEDWQRLAEDDYAGMFATFAKNPGGALNQMVEQTPNSLPALAIQIPVGIASSALYATGVGAPLAMGLQAVASFVGNVLPEGGAVIEERLAKSGINPNDTAAVAKWIAENRGANLEAGIKKAGGISLVDGATGYLAGKLIAGPSIRFAQAEAQVLSKAGVNTTDKAAVAAARATPAYKQAMAAPAQDLLDATTRAQKVVREVGGFSLEAAGEGVGEYAGSYAANGEASVKDAILEGAMGAGTSAAMTGANMALGAAKGPDMDRAALEALAATPQPTIKPNSPLSNAAGIAQAAQANAAAQSNLAIQQQALADQEAASYGGAPAVDPSAAAQDAIRRRLMAAQREAAPQQDYSSAEDAENEIGQATGIDQQDQILEFNRLLAEEQASLAEQRGDIAEAQRIRSAEMASREAIRASRARNSVGKPSGSFGQMNEFADLLSEEQADIESRRADAASRRKLQAESELQAADARVSAQMARESESRRRAVLDAILTDPDTANPAARFSAELNRQGFLDSSPTQDELAAIERFDDLKAADFQPDVEPAAPNELDLYEPPKQAAKPAGKRFITPADIRRMVADGANLSKDTLTLPDGSTVRLKGPHIAAARKAISDRRKAQDGTQPGTPDAEVASEAPKERGSVVSGSTGNAPADSDGRPEGRDGADAAVTEPGLRADRADRDGGLVSVAQPEIRSAIDAAAHEAATSPLNDTPHPTDAQKEAGNYKVGRIRIQGMDISIENPKGSKRSGVSPDGVRWESTMANHYGYFPGTKAADGDNLDVFVTDGAEDAPSIFIIDQRNQDGSFDEHKAVFGPRAEEEARAAYLANYEPGWTGLGAISSMPVDAFKAWAFDGKKKRKPLAYVVPEVIATEEDSASADPREAYADEKERAYIAKRGGVAPPKAAMAVRVGAYREYDRKQAELARPNPLDVPSDEVTRASDETVDALSEDEAKAVVVRLGKKPGKDPYATIKAEHPDDIARAISGDTWSAGRWIPAQQPIRGESAANQEPVKNEPPANTGDSADRNAGNQEPIKNAEPSPIDFTPKQYHEARMKWVAQEYGLSNAEVRQDYDTDAARKADDDAWVAAVRQAFKEGREVPRSTLDKLEELRPGAFGSFLHDYPDAKVPAGYQTPDARATEKASADAKKDARSDVAQPSDLASIFTGLSSRGLAKSRAKKAAEAHPRAAQIAYVQDNFHDILTELEDNGLVKINCD